MLDPYSRLQMEYNSIRSIIESYTKGSITCYFDGLRKAMDNYEKEKIIYNIEKINKWYSDNIVSIKSNRFVTESQKKEHEDGMIFLKEILPEIKDYDFNLITNKKLSGGIRRNNVKKVFLSHSSADKKYANALEKLIVGLGVKDNQLIYTSHPLHKIPLGQKIYDYLRDNISDQVFMIILWSNNYLDSPACLCEMGAVWVMQTDYISIYSPEFSFGNPKYREVPVDTTKMGAVLNGDDNCKASMYEFKDKIQDFFGLKNDETKTALLIDDFIKEIKKR
ncbi:MAG: toll/interleukin-1 receptor domain-containing protein [Lachnospiraceae bacterium]|nr:toll/interleukin-1 receptor domain-containing protein [Lachnospiraceae bacterium]